MVQHDRQDFDNLVWDKNDEAWAESQEKLQLKSTCLLVESLVEQKLGKHATLIPPMIIGGYNVLYRMRLDDGSPDVMVRLPSPSQSQFPTEKTLREAATAKYIEQNTEIPVPKIFCYGQKSDVGPFIILEYIDTQTTISDAITTKFDDPNEPHVLDPNISETLFETLCNKVACCLLQLLNHTFPRIGSLVETDESYFVAARPITQNMSNMVQLAGIPTAIFPPEDKTYETADLWYVELAEMHMAQLVFQHNDFVLSEDDCRNKYVARQLFRRLAKQGRLSTFGFAQDDWSAQSKSEKFQSVLSQVPSGTDSFRLWCDDFRAGNILINEFKNIVGVIDWEFAYTAPTQFSLDPPWWLLLELPEMWTGYIDKWCEVYEKRLKTWLSAMKQAEESLESNPFPIPLSVYMQESWETGRFWLNYSARKSWAFDTIFWKYLDERFFGTRGENIPKGDLWKTRVDLLSVEEKAAMEPFVERKMAVMEERIIVQWDPKEARDRLSEILFY